MLVKTKVVYFMKEIEGVERAYRMNAGMVSIEYTPNTAIVERTLFDSEGEVTHLFTHRETEKGKLTAKFNELVGEMITHKGYAVQDINSFEYDGE